MAVFAIMSVFQRKGAWEKFQLQIEEITHDEEILERNAKEQAIKDAENDVHKVKIINRKILQMNVALFFMGFVVF